MSSDFDQAFSVDNLSRAWRWTHRSPDAMFTNYFRHIYRAYSLAVDNNLLDLRTRLIKDTYRPSHSAKVYFPKSSGILRTYTLLTAEDQIVYQALVNVIAEKLLPRVKHRYNKQVFGHLYAGKRAFWFYRNWREGYRKFSDAIRTAYTNGYIYSAS